MLTPRDYQSETVAEAAAWAMAAKPCDRLLYSSVTGSGKSVMELMLLAILRTWWLITPRIEILAGMLEKLGEPVQGASEAMLIAMGGAHRIALPTRLRNAMLRGEHDAPAGLILDEAHHDGCDTWEQVASLTGDAPRIGFTGTPFRGTPRATAKFLEAWGKPRVILDYPQAVARGVVSFPRCQVVPLVDDDKILVRNGQFEVSGVNAETASRLLEAVRLCRQWHCGHCWDRATMASLPTTELARQFAELLCSQGTPASCVTAATSRAARDQAFSDCVGRHRLLVQVNVVSEGVDLPIRRLVDLSPMISPVKFLQQLGRIMRPSDEPPHYVGTNRNLLRHGYLLSGCLPPSAMAEAQQAFAGPGQRSVARVVGLEALGRLKAAELPLAGGLTGHMYVVAAVEGAQVTEYCALAHPLQERVIWASRDNARTDGKTRYGRWRVCEPPEDLAGFASLPPSPVTPKQEAWWRRSASRHGLDPDAKITRKVFAALPVLSDLRCSI